MASKISICNQALSEIGSDTISSMDDGTEASKSCSTHYDSVLKELLEKRHWSFATKRATMAELVAPPAYGYSTAYQIPVDCVRLQAVENADGIPYKEWVREANKIYIDSDDVNIRYTSADTDPEVYSGSFESAMVYLLASRLAVPLTRSRELRNELMNIAERKIIEACAEDGANSAPTGILQNSSKLVNARSKW